RCKFALTMRLRVVNWRRSRLSCNEGQAMTDGDSQPLVGAHSGLPLAVYEQLKAIARVRMAGERTGHTLQTTALVHEAYMRLTRAGTLEGNDRPRFFRAAAEAMRHVLIDHARAKGRV